MLGTLRSPTSRHSPTACATAWSRYYVLSEALTWRSRAYEVLFQALMWRQRAYDVSRDGTAAGSTCDGLPPRKQGTRHAVNNFQARPMDALQNRFSKAFGGVSKSRQPRKPLSTPPAHLYAQVVKGALMDQIKENVSRPAPSIETLVRVLVNEQQQVSTPKLKRMKQQ